MSFCCLPDLTTRISASLKSFLVFFYYCTKLRYYTLQFWSICFTYTLKFSDTFMNVFYLFIFNFFGLCNDIVLSFMGGQMVKLLIVFCIFSPSCKYFLRQLMLIHWILLFKRETSCVKCKVNLKLNACLNLYVM